MKIRYYGKSDEDNRRCAEFTYKEKEADKFYRIMQYIEKEYGFKFYPVSVADDGVIMTSTFVADRHEFEELKEAWKDAKKVIL